MPTEPVFFNILKLQPYIMHILVGLLLITNLTTVGLWYNTSHIDETVIAAATIDNKVLKTDNAVLTARVQTHVNLEEQLQAVIKEEQHMLKNMQITMDTTLVNYTQTLERLNKENNLRMAKLIKMKINKRQYSGKQYPNNLSRINKTNHSKYG